MHYIRTLLLGNEIASLVFGQAGFTAARISACLSSAQSCRGSRSQAGARVGRSLISGFLV
ncbi:MAG: hypothetical protein PHS80_01660 [Methanothrix sp.]|nr:hypothetical protein [Methanothrix sp.]MDD4446228.1 hypothetical protein [Methanothrix sp.]